MPEASQNLPRQKLVDWRRFHLIELIHHTRATTPFYKLRLNKLFLPNGMIDWKSWYYVPIVTREHLSNQYGEMLSIRPVAQRGPFSNVYSCGSTGHPVTVRTPRSVLNSMSRVTCPLHRALNGRHRRCNRRERHCQNP